VPQKYISSPVFSRSFLGGEIDSRFLDEGDKLVRQMLHFLSLDMQSELGMANAGVNTASNRE